MMHSSRYRQPAGIPSAAAQSCLTPTATAIGCRRRTETTVMTAVNSSTDLVQLRIVAAIPRPTPRWPNTASRAVASCMA